MARSNIDKCEVCGSEYPIANLRFNKCRTSGEWEYQCKPCRDKIKSGELNH